METEEIRKEEQIDLVKHALKQAVRFIIQREVADRVWYQDKDCEEQLQKGLSEAEDKLVDHISSLHSSWVKEIINELESNPNEDGSTSPNIQHWIEKKQSQLRKKML